MAACMDVDASDDGGEMMEANQQLERELLQCQQSPSPTIVHSERIISLGISPHYVSHWTTADAFLELYQNWKDAILERFQLDRHAFRPYFEDACDHYAVMVPDPTDMEGRRFLGFIKHDKKSSQVTLANAGMQLPVEALELGFTTKSGQDHLAGSHGEGLKLAAVALSRDGYRTDGAEDMAELRFQNERDVAVLIGPGCAGQGRSVSPEEFLDWLQISFDIRGLTYPSSVVETSEGDLLFDPHLHGRIYAHGVLLPGANWTHSFRLGYNFPRGKATRDRQWLMDRHGVAERVCRIWESALQAHEDVLLPIYVDLLRKTPAPMDVDMAADLLLPPTASRIWKHLRDESQGKKFFYCETAGAQDVMMIRATIGSGRVGCPRSCGVCCDRPHAFAASRKSFRSFFGMPRSVAPPDTIFSRTVQKALRACLALLDSMRGIHVVYAQGVEGRADVLYDPQQRTLKIHRRWLDFEAIHQRQSCRHWIPRGPNKGSGKYELFFCGHVVEELLSLCISSVFGPLTTLTPSERGLIITWEDDETESFRKHGLGGGGRRITLYSTKKVVLAWSGSFSTRIPL
ncbi:uncharacterized protein N7469_002082 [Penicillium citrinum]|uniref:Uncharacterized protein n=1 Tax=Penicillium citrinum TaxID=5077 RepID=A0A9W9PAJ3_PENCI|nr:uncharacterized protein N7469_002082 [Penicillium citrinum]KAJ5240491.1 hypothetical protein N7469_002082 [Penicillium citrinum]